MWWCANSQPSRTPMEAARRLRPNDPTSRESDVDALGDGRMPDILGDRMRIVPGVVDVGHILDPVSKGVAVEACIKRHAVSCIGGIEPSLYGDGHRERWR